MTTETNKMIRMGRRPTIISPAGHIRSYNLANFLALIFTGSILCYVGGYINTICIVGVFEMPVSAFTGGTSRMSIELAKGNFGIALHYFLAICSFVLGSFTSGALVGGSSFRIQRPYGLVLLVESFALASGYIFDDCILNLGGSSVTLKVGTYLISHACGLQNGMCTTFSGAVIRTTHVTGILTDIGLILGQALFHERTRKHLWKLKVFLPLYAAFCLGGITAWFAYRLLLMKAILLPCGIVGISGIVHICYCKIILKYKTRQTNEQRLKIDDANGLFIPVMEDDKPINKDCDKQDNEIDQGEQNTAFLESPLNLQNVFTHNT